MDIDFRVAFVLLPVIAAVSWALFNMLQHKADPSLLNRSLGLGVRVRGQGEEEEGHSALLPYSTSYSLFSPQPFLHFSTALGSRVV